MTDLSTPRAPKKRVAAIATKVLRALKGCQDGRRIGVDLSPRFGEWYYFGFGAHQVTAGELKQLAASVLPAKRRSVRKPRKVGARAAPPRTQP